MFKQILKQYLCISIGTFLLAFSIEVFFLPSKISSGGISSIGTVLYYTFGIPLSITNILFNVILFGFGLKYLKKGSVAKTVFGIASFGVFLEILTITEGYRGEIFISTVTGGVIMGIGIGLVIRAGGSTGGSDFAGVILNKLFPHISIPKLIFYIDTIIIVISGIAFKSFEIIVYSGIALYLSSKMGDAVVYVGNTAKHIFIISDKAEDISSKILSDCARGATGIYCKGMYSSKEKLGIMCVVSPRETARILNIIRKTDKNAFVVITDVKEVMGEGFKGII